MTLLGAIILSLVLLFSNDSRQVNTIKTWALGGFGYLSEKVAFVYRLNRLYEENERLRQKSSRLMLENSRLKEADLENKRLRALLDFKTRSKLQLVAAKVIGHQQNALVNAIMISAGTADGLRKNMAVVTADGLLGKVFQTSRHYASVQLLLDRNFRVSAVVRRSRVNGIVKWTQGNRVVLAEVNKRSDVKVGDEVATSGFSAIFPEGLTVGRVVKVADNDRSLFMDVLVEPSVDFSRVEEVFVVQRVRQPVNAAE